LTSDSGNGQHQYIFSSHYNVCYVMVRKYNKGQVF
jgi:hypothetical protein